MKASEIKDQLTIAQSKLHKAEEAVYEAKLTRDTINREITELASRWQLAKEQESSLKQS